MKCAWEIQEFAYTENIKSQRIDFSIDDHEFVIFFTPVFAFEDENSLIDRAKLIGFDPPRNSYDVKFDRIENFEECTYYQPPAKDSHFSVFNTSKMRRLGAGLSELLLFHCNLTKAEAYFGVAENQKLKIYYDRLVKKYAYQLNFRVISNIGEEGLDYAIQTSYYQSKS